MAATTPGLEGFAALGTVGIGAVAVLYLGFFAFVTYELYRFGTALHGSAARGTSNEQLEAGFSHLATLFKVLVILTAVFVAFGLVALLAGLGAAASF